MKPTADQFQPLTLPNETGYQPDSVRTAQEMERLELLVPEISRTPMRDLQTYALAYVERYQDDVLQLEHEWEFLYAALTQAWQQAEYAVVVRLVTSLAHPVGRLSNPAVAEHILHLGIEASRRTQDRGHLARFLNRLGGLLFSHGKYRQGRQIWCTSLELARSSGSSAGLWEPLCSFVHMADILGSYTAAQQFVETLLHSSHNDPDSFAVAVFIQGFFARLANNLEGAYEHFSCCLRLLSRQTPGARLPAYRQLFTLVVQAELARVQGNYARSQEYANTALSLAQIFGYRFTVADLLIDQLLFTCAQEQFADAQAIFLRLCDVSRRSEAPHLYERCCLLEQRLAAHLPKCSSQDQPIPSTALPGLQEALSEREIEVLQLVAEGLSNQAIARRLVISSGTVKKHLEHIYNKLNVHSRTSSIARARALKIFS